ncbi:hypothetical protein ACEPPN_010149 [Leptodophora sp. 'Broadleaf-Isolate-01']
MEVDIFHDWARAVAIFINHGAKLDVAYQGILMGKTARQCIQERLISVSQTTRPLCGEDHDSLRTITELLDDILESHRGGKGNATSKKWKVKNHRQDIDALPSTPPTSDNEVAAASLGRTFARSFPPKTSSGISSHIERVSECRRCKAIEQVSQLGFSANDGVNALDRGGVGIDIQALISWLLDHRANLDGKITNHSNKVSDQKTWLAPKLSKTAWTVVNSSASGQVTKTVVDAEYLPGGKASKPRSRKSPKDIAPKNVPAEGTSSTSIIYLDTGSFTWFLDEVSGLFAAPMLSATQTQALGEFVNELVDELVDDSKS